MNYCESKFYFCQKCGVVVELLSGTGDSYICCNKNMKELAQSQECENQEKHMPMVETSNGVITVKIGTTLHPMDKDHCIDWIYLKTTQGCQRKGLTHGNPPLAKFAITSDDVPIAAFAYCNLHGFWKTDIK